MKTKRIVSVLLIAILLVLLVGCSDNSNSEDSSTSNKVIHQITEQAFLETAVSNNLMIEDLNKYYASDVGALRQFCIGAPSKKSDGFAIYYSYFLTKEQAVAQYNKVIWEAEEDYYKSKFDSDTYSYSYKNTDNYNKTDEIGSNYLYHICQTTAEDTAVPYYYEICCVDSTILILRVRDISVKDKAVDIFTSLLE